MKILFLFLLPILLISACDNQKPQEPEVAYNAELDFQCFQYFYGNGVKQDLGKAIPICIEAADSGAQGSQYITGMVYLTGVGREMNKDKAIYWLTKSADRGHTGAIEQLEKLYIN